MKPKTINQFIADFGVTQSHLADHGISYHASLKYGDTPLDELPTTPVNFKEAFKKILKLHGVKA